MFRNIIKSTATIRRSIINKPASFSTSTILKNEVPKSSCPAGTVLNLKVRQRGDEPVALEDSEYPEWLWKMLDPELVREEIKNEDFMRWRKIQLRKANAKRIKQNNFMETMKK
ncbi:MRPL37 [[Candida] subhashii]|uniref:Large ribosomal subunit protein mL54 n=1 Tax=[Candida] subhashii TaxID=561895 RepID=A0A8J5QED4_9ASCO|nr:MRPL37 [[Candida] subhashii]KAG7660744.1 MRPL37 [[Candida] subhashii]